MAIHPDRATTLLHELAGRRWHVRQERAAHAEEAHALGALGRIRHEDAVPLSSEVRDVVKLGKVLDRGNLEGRIALRGDLPHELQHHDVAGLPADEDQRLLGALGHVLGYLVELRAGRCGSREDALLRSALAVVEAAKEGRDVAVGPQPAALQAEAPLPLVGAQGILVELHLAHQLPLQRPRQHGVRHTPWQGEREERPRSHLERGEESLVASRGALALDNVEELAALRRLAEDRRAREAAEHEVARAEEEVPKALQLLGVLGVGPNEVVDLVHDNHLVRVDVAGAPLVANLHERGRGQSGPTPALADACEAAARGGVAEGAHRRRGHLFARVPLLEVLSEGCTHPPHVEHALHLEDLSDRVPNPPRLLLGEVAQGPHAGAHLAPVWPTARNLRVGGALAAEVVPVAVGPSEQLRVEVPAHGVLREDGDLGPRIVEVVVQDLDDLARLPGACGVIDEEPRDRALGVQEEGHGLLVRLERVPCTLSRGLWLDWRADARLAHDRGAPPIEALQAWKDRLALLVLPGARGVIVGRGAPRLRPVGWHNLLLPLQRRLLVERLLSR
mmetsp:Transcript_88238/g.234313  ORF Transcript_88238/g.234313 Transcript_88238/m.234313 type:complete len:561 (+) Transcript_88238:662-2344(+)